MARRVLWAAMAIAIAAGPTSAGDVSKECRMPVQECIARMSASLKTTGWVGLEYDDVERPGGGFRITKVIEGSPAEHAGLLAGDVLYALNGERLSNSNAAAVARVRKEWKPGQSVTYTIKREGANRDITLTLAPMPADVMARWIGEHMKEHEAAERAAAK